MGIQFAGDVIVTPELLEACAANGVSPECFQAGLRQRWSLRPQVSRHRACVAERAKVMGWLRARDMSLWEIARLTGLRSHTTVLYALMRANGQKVRVGRKKIKVIIVLRKDRPVNIQTQRKLAAMKAEERQTAQEAAANGSGSTLTVSQQTETRKRCPACGLRQLSPTSITDAKGRTLWECRRFDPMCGWKAWGR